MKQSEVRVFLALAVMAGGEASITFQNGNLIKQSGVCKSLVQTAIWSLHKRGILHISERLGGSANRTTIEFSPDWVSFREDPELDSRLMVNT
jgi:hypothetical protein